MAEGSSSGSPPSGLSFSEKHPRAMRALSPRMGGSEKSGKALSPRAGRGAEGSSNDDNQANPGDLAKPALSPRSAPLAMLVKNLGIRSAEPDVVPFEPPASVPVPEPVLTSSKKKNVEDEDWDDGPDSKRASVIGSMGSSSGLNLKVDDLKSPDELFDPTPRQEPAQPSIPSETPTPTPSAASNESSTPLPASSSSGSIISSSSVPASLSNSTIVNTSAEPAAASPAASESSAPSQSEPAAASPSASPVVHEEAAPSPSTPAASPAPVPTEPAAASTVSPAPASASEVLPPATASASAPASAPTSAPVSASSTPVASPATPGWSSGKVEQLAAADKARPLSAELAELRKLQAEVRRLKSNAPATTAAQTLTKTPSGSGVVNSSTSPPSESPVAAAAAASSSGTPLSPRSASLSSPAAVDQTSAATTALSTSPPAASTPQQTAQPAAAAAAAATAAPTTAAAKLSSLPLLTSPHFIKKPAAVSVEASPKQAPAAAASSSSSSASAAAVSASAVAPTPPPAMMKPIHPKVNKKGDAKPSVFSLFGVGDSSASSSPAPPAAAAAAPPQKPKSAITNLHEPVRMKATPAVAKDPPCRICQAAPLTHLFQPCGHRAACQDCAADWLANVRTCPLCSQTATAIAPVPPGSVPIVPVATNEMGLLQPYANAITAPAAPPSSSSSSSSTTPPSSAAIMGSPPPAARQKQQPQLTRYASIRQVGLFQYLTAAGASPEQLQEVEKIDVT